MTYVIEQNPTARVATTTTTNKKEKHQHTNKNLIEVITSTW
jgi:hypothetical protein